jgi:hypothetical protein
MVKKLIFTTKVPAYTATQNINEARFKADVLVSWLCTCDLVVETHGRRVVGLSTASPHD